MNVEAQVTWTDGERFVANAKSGRGFKQVRLFGDQQGAPYDLDANRLIAVARKSNQ